MTAQSATGPDLTDPGTHAYVKLDGWTVNDLYDLPEGPRYEIVDGCLEVSPPEAARNYFSAHRIVLRLEALLPFAQYAEVGIPHHWRFAPKTPVLVAYALDGTTYRETGRFTDQVELDAPVRLRFALADLLP